MTKALPPKFPYVHRCEGTFATGRRILKISLRGQRVPSSATDAPRGFPTILTADTACVHQGSGRAELADAIVASPDRDSA